MLFDVFNFLGIPIAPNNFYSAFGGILICFGGGSVFGVLFSLFEERRKVNWNIFFYLLKRYKCLDQGVIGAGWGKDSLFILQLIYKLGVASFIIGLILYIVSFYIGEYPA